MRDRTLTLVAVLGLIAGTAAPANAHQWRSPQPEHWRERDRPVSDHPRQDQQPQLEQPYWGTMRPYWGTMRPYWGPNEPPGVIHRGARTRDLEEPASSKRRR